MSKKSTIEEFIEKSTKIHGDKYDYSKFVYVNSKYKSTLICKKCNYEFYQCPNSHLSGRGCPKCANKIKGNRDTLEDFVKKIK